MAGTLKGTLFAVSRRTIYITPDRFSYSRGCRAAVLNDFLSPAQHGHRIQPRCAADWKVAGNSGDQQQDANHHPSRKGIDNADVTKTAANQTKRTCRADSSYRDAGRSEPHSFSNVS